VATINLIAESMCKECKGVKLMSELKMDCNGDVVCRYDCESCVACGYLKGNEDWQSDTICMECQDALDLQAEEKVVGVIQDLAYMPSEAGIKAMMDGFKTRMKATRQH